MLDLPFRCHCILHSNALHFGLVTYSLQIFQNLRIIEMIVDLNFGKIVAKTA
jgi:hypothetical protein